MNQKNIFFVNGKYLTESKASISVNDLGLQRGYGVFEVIRTFNKKPFLLEQHLDRLFHSAKLINLTIPYKKSEITQTILSLINKNRANEFFIKIIVTGGDSSDGISLGKKPTIIVIVKPLTSIDVQSGIKLITVNYIRDIPPAKTLNYIELIKNNLYLKKQKAYTLLYIFKNKVLEGATCNIFIIKKNIIKTPKSNVLNGITQRIVISLIENNSKYSVSQENISLKELIRADEVFITSTTKGVVPVVRIDNNKIADGKPGKITKDIIKIFNEFTSKN